MSDDRANILLVDDRPQNLLALAAILEPLGHTLVQAGSGEDALRCLLKEEFALVLLDVQMPELDGFETAALIKRRSRTRNVPIIFLTALSSDTKQISRGYSGGAVDYIVKPFDPDLLRSKVSVFVELHEKNKQIERQAEQLRKRELADARRRSEERYRQLADAMPQIVWTSDPDGRTTYRNRRFYQFTGIDPDAAPGDAWSDVVHPDDLPTLVERRQRTVATGEVFEAEYRMRSADGEYRWHLGRAVPITGLAGDIDLWVGTATDIDEQKRLYEQVEEQARAARVIGAIGDGVFLLDLDGVVRLWNPAAEAATGLLYDDVLGRPLGDVLPAWESIASRVPISSTPGSSSIRPETLPLEVDGKERWLSISGVGFNDGTVYAFRDITDERALEELRQEFVATVSHELRTPLAAVYGAALTVRRDDLDMDEEMRDRLLTIISDEASRLGKIVDDLLFISNPDRLQVTLERCDPLELVESVVEAARIRLPEGASVELNAPKRLPAVEADRGHLHQVLSNLVDNALKYSPDGGPVTVSLGKRQRFVRFAVRDEGLGIPRTEQGRIFEKFYRLDPEMTRGVGGTGLGLYICRELVRQLRGEIWVTSREGEGSTFFVEIPVAPASTNGKRQAKKPAPVSSR